MPTRRRQIGMLLACILALLAGLHAYWALGGRWGLAEALGGAAQPVPSPWMIWVVVGLLGAAACVVLGRIGLWARRVPQRLFGLASWATADQLEALLQVADQVTMEVVPEHPLHPEYGLKTEEPKKLATVRSYLRELLILTNGTGRRIGAVRTLTFADLRLDVKPWGAIHWPAHSDKAGYESTAEISVEVRAVLDAILDERPGAGSAPLFPAPSDPTKPVDKYFTDKLRQRGIALARRKAREEGRAFELPSRWGFHSFRRKFATELKTAPDKDVADLGGWRDVNTLRQVYQRSDHESRVAALMNRLELREAKG